MKRGLLKYFLSIVLGLGLVAFYMPRLSADESTPDNEDTLDLVVGDIETVPVNGLTRVSVTDPEVADISDAQSDKVLVLAKKAGQTVLYLWDSAGKRSMVVRVVSEELKAVKERVQKVMEEAGITGLSLEENHDIGKVVISGTLSKDDKTRLGDILEPYHENLLNLVKIEENKDLIQVDMKIVEINTSYEKNLGILWSAGGNTGAGTIAGSTGSNSTSSQTGIQLGYNENMNTTGDSFADLFRIGNFQRTTPLEATVNALIQEGKARLISKPRLVVVSGKQASFLVGGEIPIQNTTTSAIGGTVGTSTTYAQYGVNLQITPTIREGKIDVVLNVDIRDIDASTPLNSGSVAFVTRTASTDLFMDNKQTIVLAGLIKYSDGVTYTKVPFLGYIPILGAIFRNRSEPADANTEMVIILTPTVLTDKKFADNQVVMPTPMERDAYKEWDAKYEHEPLPNWSADKGAAASAVSTKDSSTDVGAMTAAYARLVQEKISKSISYPQAAMGNAWAGTVKLKLHILKDGSLDSEEVMESSGYDILDQDAMNAAKTAAPYDAFTAGMDQEDLIFTVPIVYNKLSSNN